MATRVGWSPGPASWKDDLTPIAAADWNEDRAAHLLAHAGFGGTPAEIDALARAGRSARSARSSPTKTFRTRRCSRSSSRGSGIRRSTSSRRAGRRPRIARSASAAQWARPSSRVATGQSSPSRIASSTGFGRRCSKPGGWGTGGRTGCCRRLIRSSRRWRCCGTATSPPTRTRCAITARCGSRSSCSSAAPLTASASSRFRSPRTRRCWTSSTRSTTSRAPRTRTSPAR